MSSSSSPAPLSSHSHPTLHALPSSDDSSSVSLYSSTAWMAWSEGVGHSLAGCPLPPQLYLCPFLLLLLLILLLLLLLPTVILPVVDLLLLAFQMAELFRVASLFLAASSCLSTHRSDRRYLHPLPQLLQRPWAHDSAASSSPRHGRYVLGPRSIVLPSLPSASS